MRWIWLFVLWGCMWILMGLGPLNLLILPVMVFLAVNAFQSRSWRPIMILAASPLAVLFMAGALAWFAEQPAYRCVGLGRGEFYNLDRDSRTYAATSGCVIYGGEFLRDEPWNLGLSLMSRAFGWPLQAYQGAYPTPVEAARLTESAPPLLSEEFEQGKIKIGKGRTLDLGKSQAYQMLLDSGGMAGAIPEIPLCQIRVAQVGDECVVLRVTHAAGDYTGDGMDVIYLIDPQQKWPFARYVLAGDVASFPFFGGRMRL